MPGSRLPEDGTGFLPRKVAEMLQSDAHVHAALMRVSTLVKTIGLSPRVIERVMVAGEDVSADVLALLSRGLCDSAPKDFGSLVEALNSEEHEAACRACLVATWRDFVNEAAANTGLSPAKITATSLATAETAYWLAGRHIIAPGEAFRDALLADIGLVTMAYALPDVYSTLALTRIAQPLQEFERNSLGFDHQEVGELVLKLYKFPDAVADFAAVHHLSSIEQDLGGKVLKAAAVAVESVGGDFGLQTPLAELDRQTLEGALLKETDGPEVLQYAQGRLQAALRFTERRGSSAA